MGLARFIVRRILKVVEKHDQELLSGHTLPDGIIVKTDIPYQSSGQTDHLLDVYYPENATEKLPVVIDIHGGGFVHGYKELNKTFCCHLAKRGFVVFNLNYRLALRDATVYDQIQDVLSALDWIGSNLNTYPADPDQVFIAGDSAGGVLAMTAALITQSRRMQTLFEAEPPRLRFQSIGIISGMMSFHLKDTKYNLLRSVCFEKGYKQKEYYQNMIFDNIPEMKDLPPVFLVTSEEDLLFYMTMEFEKTLQRYHVPYRLKVFPKGDGRMLGHVFGIQHPEYEESAECVDEMAAFFLSAVRQAR